MATSDSTPKKPAAKKPAASNASAPKKASPKKAPSGTASTASTPTSTASTPTSAPASREVVPTAPSQPQGPPPGAVPAPGQPQPILESDARTYAMLSHLSPLVLGWTGIGWVGTLVFYLIYKDRSLLVREHGREELNLQLTLIITLTGATILTVVTLGLGSIVLFPAFGVFALVAFVIQIIACVKAYNGEYYRYGIAFPILR